ncbi:MAG TPA: HD domain-containing protein [Cytophagales bacterium]|nr:HD domain-containing protein [Cytophagales bacterium]
MNYSDKINQIEVLKEVGASARELGLKAYAVGGFVRDLVLGRPCKDIDIVCIGSGIGLAEHVAKKTGTDRSLAVFKNFGTAMIKVGDWEIEFVGARKESYRSDSRKPLVEDGSLQDDQNRRDLTINAMSISLNEGDYGALIDPFDGLGDLRRKIVKTPLEPGITFSDDPLRMMRAIRFASQLNFDIEPETFSAIIQHVDRLDIISQERITEELNKIILSPRPSYGFKLLFQSQILKKIFPEMCLLHGVDTIDGKAHKDNFYHTLKVLDNVAKVSDDLWLRWAAILHDIAKPATKRFDKKVGWTFHGHEEKGARMTPTLFKKLKLPLGEPLRYVQNLVRLHLRPIALVKETITDSAIRRLLFEASNDIEGLMILCRADVTSKDDNKVKKYLDNFDKVERKMAEVESKDHMRNWQPAITGEIIMKVFDLRPSKEVGVIKNMLREAILDGKVENTLESGYHFMVHAAKTLNLEVKNPLQLKHEI